MESKDVIAVASDLGLELVAVSGIDEATAGRITDQVKRAAGASNVGTDRIAERSAVAIDATARRRAPERPAAAPTGPAPTGSPATTRWRPLPAEAAPSTSEHTLAPSDGPTGRLPMIFIYMWVVFLPFQFILGSSRRPLQIAPSDFVLAMAVLVLAPQLRLRPRVWTVWHFAFPAVFAVSVLTGGAVSRYSLANKLLGMLVLLAAYTLITTFVRSWSEVRLVMRAFVASVVVVNTVTSVAKVVGVTLPYTRCHSPDCVRLTGYFPDANLYGSLLVVAIAFMLGTMGTDARLFVRLRTTVFAFVSLGVGLFLTLSRSSWIGMALVLVALVFLRPGQGARIVVFGGAVVSSLLTFVLAERSDLLLSTAGRRFTIDSRLQIIDNAIKAFQENPFFGIGLGNFAERHNVIVHNTVLWLAAELGVVGLVLLVGLMGFVIKQLWYVYSHTSGTQQAIVTALALAHLAMMGFSIGVEAFYQRHWWLALSLISVLYARVHEQFDVVEGKGRDHAGSVHRPLPTFRGSTGP